MIRHNTCRTAFAESHAGMMKAGSTSGIVAAPILATLFVFAGVLKGVAAVSSALPWDLTILLGTMTVVSLMLRALVQGRFTPVHPCLPDLWMMGFAACVLLGCWYTPASLSLSLGKAARFAGPGVMASYLLPRIISAFGGAQRTTRVSLMTLLAVGAILSVYTFLHSPGLTFARSPGGSYLSWGYLLGGALLATIGALAWSRLKIQRMLLLIIVALLCGALVYARGRGPILALAGVAAIWCVAAHWIRVRTRVIVALSGLALIGIMLSTMPSDMQLRYTRLLTGDVDGSIQSRVDAYRTAWLMFLQSPLLGKGTASFRTVHERFEYPHSILLETLAEQGLVGGLTLLGVVATTLVRLRRSLQLARGPDRVVLATAGSLFLFMLIGSMFSGDITSRSLWFSAGITVMCTEAIRRSRVLMPDTTTEGKIRS